MMNDAHKKSESPLANFTATNLISRLELLTLNPKVIVDLSREGSASSSLLKKQYAEAEIIIANEAWELPINYTSLPLQSHSVDFLFANLVLSWQADWEKILREWRRVLKPEGLLMFSCLGLDTLRLFPEKQFILPRLIDMHEVGDLIVGAKFSDPVLDVEHITFAYREADKFVVELKSEEIISPEFSTHHLLPDPLVVTYELIYGHAFGPSLSVDHVADDEGIVRIPLDYLRGRRGLK